MLMLLIFIRKLSCIREVMRNGIGVDMFRCFPIVPKLACQHLGIHITRYEKPITLLGGLTSFGGAGNNYSMHVSPTFLENGNRTEIDRQ